MKSILLVLLVLATHATAEDTYIFELDATVVDLEHAWRGPDNYAQFTETLHGAGITVWDKSNFGLRVAYLDGKDMNTAGRYSGITVKLKYIASLELLYKYQVTDKLRAVIGVGTNLIPLPMYWDGIDPSSHAATDADNDEGYIVGVSYRLNDDISLGWRFTHYSRIKGGVYDEWTKGHSLNITYEL